MLDRFSRGPGKGSGRRRARALLDMQRRHNNRIDCERAFR
jgi:hypothetical protein